LDTGFGYKNSNFFLHYYEFFISQKNKMKVGFDCEKNSFWREIRKLLPKIIFLSAIKPREILQKQHFFTAYEFFISKKIK
jgi:hypothetical protein